MTIDSLNPERMLHKDFIPVVYLIKYSGKTTAKSSYFIFPLMTFYKYNYDEAILNAETFIYKRMTSRRKTFFYIM